MPLILRTNKDEPLTHAELDGNLSFLDQRITSLANYEANKVITWTEIQSKPILFDGDYNSLQNIPVLFDGDFNNLTNTPVIFDGNYQNLTNKPFVPTALNDLSNVINSTPGVDQVLTWTGSTWAPQDTFDKDYNSLTNRPTIPSELGDLSNVSPIAPSEGEVLKWDGSVWAPDSDIGNIPTYAEVTDKNTANGPSKIAIGTIAGSTNQGNLAVAIGYEAGKTNQGANSIAIGVNAGETTQSTNATAVGISAGETTQGANATALGYYAGNANQGSEAVAIGDLAGSTNQGANATAVGNGAGEDTQGVSAVAIGDVAGALNQNTFAVAVGASAGMSSQGQAAVAIGKNTGETLQGSDTVAIGNSAGNANQTAKAVAVGDWAGKTDQGASAVALGHLAGTTNQGQYATALGHYAGANDQSSHAIAVGYNAAYENQGLQAIAIGVSSANNQSANAIAIGSSAANNTQGEEAIAIGKQAGNGTQGTQAIAIGTDSGLTTQSDYAIAIGQEAGKTTQGTLALAVGNSAGVTSQGNSAVALGYTAGNSNQGADAIAIGHAAGTTTQGTKSIAIGEEAGNTTQGITAVAIGSDAGKTSQGNDSVAIGTSAALITQGVNSVAIGRLAANNDQGANAVAIGDSAGKTTQGDNAIAIGSAAGETNQAANSIILNATDSALENTTADSFVVKPIRNGNGTHQLEYNPTTGEITYDALGAGGYGDADVFTYLNVTFANDGDVLSWDATAGDYAWVAQSSGGAGIALTDLSVTTASAGTAALAYNNTTGVFTYTPPDLSSFLTSETSHADVLVDGDFTSAGFMTTDGAGNYSVDTNTYTSYNDSDVDTHLNTGTATSGQILSWDGADYAWVADQTSGSGTDTVIAPFAFANVETTSNGSATGISWSNWNSGNGSLDFTFDNAQANTQYTVVTDSETFDDYSVGISNKTTTGFTAEFYDSSGTRIPSNFSPFTIIVYAETPTATITGTSLSNASIGALSDVSISSATTGQVLKYNGSSWVNDTDAGGIALADLSVGAEDPASGDGGISYDNTTGVFTYTPPDLGNAIVSQAQYTTTVTTNAADTSDTSAYIVGNTGSASATGTSTGWVFADVVQDPDNPGTTTILDVDAAIFTGSVVGNITTGSGTQTIQGTVDFTNATSVDFTGTTVTGLPASGATTMAGLTDVDSVDTVALGDVLLHDGSEYKFANLESEINTRIALQTGSNLDLSQKTTDDLAEGTNNLYIQTRTTGAATATALGDESAADITIPCAKTFTLLKIQTSHAAWVTLYIDTASRTSDASRDINTDPEAGSGVLAEVITTDGSTINITPGTIGWNNDGTPAAQVYAKVVNKSGSQQDITVTLHYVALEV